MDIADHAQEREALILQKRIEAARVGGGHMQGSSVCSCGEPNDRAGEGFATCTDCFEATMAAPDAAVLVGGV